MRSTELAAHPRAAQRKIDAVVIFIADQPGSRSAPDFGESEPAEQRKRSDVARVDVRDKLGIAKRSNRRGTIAPSASCAKPWPQQDGCRMNPISGSASSLPCRSIARHARARSRG